MSNQKIKTYLLIVLFTCAVIWVVHTTLGYLHPQVSASTSQSHQTASESDFNRVHISAETADSIGLELAHVEKRHMPDLHVYAGEMMLPSGRGVAITAPFTGIIKEYVSSLPISGTRVRKNQTLFTLVPILNPETRSSMKTALVDTISQLENGETQLRSAKQAYERASQMYEDQTGSKRAMEEAKTAYDIAFRNREAAVSKKAEIEEIVNGVGSQPFKIKAPRDAIISTLAVSTDQLVTSGHLLAEVMDTSTLWAKVPIPVGDFGGLARKSPALIANPSDLHHKDGPLAYPIDGPVTANQTTGTVDLYYSIPNSDNKLIVGQQVNISIRSTSEKPAVAIPWSAVVFDINGGTWVYQSKGPYVFERIRIAVSYLNGPYAVITSNLPLGTEIVSKGALELLGIETGFSH